MSRRPLGTCTFVFALSVVAFTAWACGGSSSDPNVKPAKAPAAGQPSAKYRIPLPQKSVAEPASASPSGEAYRVSEARLLDVNAFYEQQMDNKPFSGFTWCGGARYSDTQIVRIWLKPPSPSQQLRLELVGDTKGVLVTVNQVDDAPFTPCPPSASPNADPPFEGP